MSHRNSASKAARRCAAGAGGAAWIALVVYCLLAILVGPAGLRPYGRLEALNASMRENLEELGRKNGELRSELESLRSDADRALREARGLGYLRPGEGAILVAGRESESPDRDPGEVVPYDPPSAWPDSALKEIALGAFLAAFAVFLAPRKGR